MVGISSLCDGNCWEMLMRMALGAECWREDHVSGGGSQDLGESSTAFHWRGEVVELKGRGLL